MPDSPTPWELHRSMEALRRSLESGFANLNSRLDRVVPTDLFHAYQAAIQRQFDDFKQEIADLKAEQDEEVTKLRAEWDADKKQKLADRKLLITSVFTSLIAPFVLLLLGLWLTARGGT
ncbi:MULTISPECIES: hypothetical protein [unclassified Nonomuraea]|uniref:hypothetical protein n=1 Tax=unclassified Nonomuraea TaxID=2593643 RepID=UPI0033EBB376